MSERQGIEIDYCPQCRGVWHFNSPLEIITDSNIIESPIKMFSKYDLTLHLEKPNPVETLISNLEIAIKKPKPSMMIMLTQ